MSEEQRQAFARAGDRFIADLAAAGVIGLAVAFVRPDGGTRPHVLLVGSRQIDQDHAHCILHEAAHVAGEQKLRRDAAAMPPTLQ